MTGRASGAILCAILLMGTAAAFLPARNFAFVNLDDLNEVTENPLLHPPTADHLRQIWSGPFLKLYAPLTYTTWWTLARLGAGDNPHAFHLLNVLLHLACAALVFSILRLCVKSPAAAFGGAIVFALHPMQVESVGWVAEMNNLLAAALSLAAIRLYLASGTTTARRRWMVYALGSAAYLAALLSKPTAVVVPLIAVILDTGVLRRPLRPAVYALVPWLAAAGVFGWIAHRNQGGIAVAILDRPAVALDALGFYGRQILMPLALTIDYGRTPDSVLPGHGWVANAKIAIVLGLLFWLLRRRRRGMAMGAIIAVAALLPVLGLVPFAFQEISTVADHFAYLAMFGPALAAATLLAGPHPRALWPIAAAAGLILALLGVDLLQIWLNGQTLVALTLVVRTLEYLWTFGPALAAATLLAGLHPRAVWPIAAAAGLILALHSVDQLQIWRNSQTVVAHTLAIDPASAMGNSMAGSELNRQGHPEQAIPHFFVSLERDPKDPYVQYNLANALASVGKYDQAIEHFQIAIALFDPPSWRAMNNLGIAYAKIGERDRAAAQFERVLEIDPNNPQAIQNLQILGERVPSR